MGSLAAVPCVRPHAASCAESKTSELKTGQLVYLGLFLAKWDLSVLECGLARVLMSLLPIDLFIYLCASAPGIPTGTILTRFVATVATTK